MKSKKKDAQSSLEGWSKVIREQGADYAVREKARKEQAVNVLEAAANLPLKEQMIVLFTSVGAGILTNREFFDAAHKVLGLPKLE